MFCSNMIRFLLFVSSVFRIFVVPLKLCSAGFNNLNFFFLEEASGKTKKIRKKKVLCKSVAEICSLRARYHYTGSNRLSSASVVLVFNCNTRDSCSWRFVFFSLISITMHRPGPWARVDERTRRQDGKRYERTKVKLLSRHRIKMLFINAYNYYHYKL